MREEIIKVMKDLDAAAARLNAGLTAVAVVLSLAVSFALTVKLGEMTAPDMAENPVAMIAAP